VLIAVSLAIVAAALCAWGTLCLLFWQGSWQLLYHPTPAASRTPADIGLRYDSVGFAVTASGSPTLHGWWVPGDPGSRYTAIYLHGADGNLGDTADALIALHTAGLNVFAFDYRGYGHSKFERPSEARWREDAESAIDYLTNTRHIAASSLILIGQRLGANLALKVAAAHPELAGTVMDEPIAAPAEAIFGDPRAKLVPAHLLARDRWNASPPAASLRIPSLWIYRTPANGQSEQNLRDVYKLVAASKEQVWLTESSGATKDYVVALTGWLDDLHL
jgi:pimeloyl-ACP methyl ester carboxylesterase